MTDDEFHRHVTREAAKAVGKWLEGRGKLHQPIRCLTMRELEAMASNAISRFIVLASERRRNPPRENVDLIQLWPGCGPAPSVVGRIGASATSIGSNRIDIRS